MTEEIDRSRCACGWKRPLVAITQLDSAELPPSTLVPCYRCPECGTWYISAELSHEDAIRVFAGLALGPD